MISVLFALAVGMAYLTLVVKRLVYQQDKLLPFIFGFMTASLATYTLYYMVAVIVEYRLDWFLSGLRSFKCSVIYPSRTGSLFLTIGVILNLAKWI